jgi:pimeloyl-ACP methyl ester carboxylesterase
MEQITLTGPDTTFAALAAGPADGPLVLLLHGFPENRWAWRGVLDPLAAAGYRAVAPDLRGFAEASRPETHARNTLQQAVEDALGIAKSLGVDGVHLVGHDLGGIVAWESACRQPDGIRTVSVFSTPHLTPFAQSLRDATVERKPPFDLFRQPTAELAMLANDAAALSRGYAGLESEAATEYVRLFSAPGVLTAMLAYFRAFDFDAWLSQPPCTLPTLFAWGADDPYLTPATAAATREHVSGPLTYRRLDGIGHWVPELATDRVIELLLTHFGE